MIPVAAVKRARCRLDDEFAADADADANARLDDLRRHGRPETDHELADVVSNGGCGGGSRWATGRPVGA